MKKMLIVTIAVTVRAAVSSAFVHPYDSRTTIGLTIPAISS
jgi:hypothetical protein